MTDVDKIGSRVAHLKGLRATLTRQQREIESILAEGGLGPEEARHIAIARTALEDSVMRLGKALQAIGEANPGLVRDPYPTSSDPVVTTIDATAREISAVPRQLSGLL